MKETGIQTIVTDEIITLAKKYNLNKVILFGSRARGDYKSRSDIDLAVSGGDCIPFSIDIQEMTSTLLFFDVVNLDGPVQKELLESIDKEGVCIYEKV
ncbi:MAG: nucleotidyltransferase domain-containing protein [Tyzzerella sp.]|nr:nucleotidyltransferase domain-containing protein [Tyzzerella sp.]